MKNRTIHYWIVILLSSLMIPCAFAGGGGDDLAPWEGVFVSRKRVVETAAMTALYERTAKAASERGKPYTGQEVRNRFREMFHTRFDTLDISGDTITFTTDAQTPPAVTHTYRFAGKMEDRYGEASFSWHAFEAIGRVPADSPYRYLLLLPISQRNGGEPHFHIRYGSKSVRELVERPGIANWWPTMLKADFDMTRFMTSFSPEEMSTVLP